MASLVVWSKSPPSLRRKYPADFADFVLTIIEMFLQCVQIVIRCADFADCSLITACHLRDLRIRYGDLTLLIAISIVVRIKSAKSAGYLRRSGSKEVLIRVLKKTLLSISRTIRADS